MTTQKVEKVVKFIDIGSNLTDLMFQGVYNGKNQHTPDLNKVIERAKNGGLDKIIITSGSYEECVQALKICEEHDPTCDFLFTTVGVHPTRTRVKCIKCSEHTNNYLSKLKELINNNVRRIVAIGEFGLDSERTHFSNIFIQEKYFELQFELLKEHKIPMFLHMRNSCTREHECKSSNNNCFMRFIEILNKYKYIWESKGGVVHSFTGTIDELNTILDMGLDVGINGCSLKSDDNLITASNIPLNRLHIETDSPWCDIKKTHSGYSYIDTHFPEVSKPTKWSEGMLVKGRNEPVKIVQVAQVLHKKLNSNLSFNEFSSQIYKNTKRMYFNSKAGITRKKHAIWS
ncbi:hypothetical protein FG386_003071 [Cryptosporidium ryanae]|uniref:uncharacterized protein n=1 Tax=Cryptosporidium ryanae TaxID=515981 RepID=UPI00351A3396|nr:hypothetical protein FG386_003071 [Cryptosporidium ryanae]